MGSAYISSQNPDSLSVLYRKGKGKPLVFCHGDNQNATFGIPLLDTFPTRPVLSIDLPGHGRSSRTARSIEEEAELVAQSIDAYFDEPVIFIGHSRGAVIGQYLAIHHESCVESLVLCNPMMEDPRKIFKWLPVSLLYTAFQKKSKRLYERGYASKYHRGLDEKSLLKESLKATPPEQVAYNLASYDGLDLCDAFCKSTTPALLCYNTRGVIKLERHCKEIERKRLKTRVYAFDTEHNYPLTHPLLLNAAMGQHSDLLRL